MLGAIIGDIVGSRFEWNNLKSKDFGLFGNDGLHREPCMVTDDSIMTVAVADAPLRFDRIDDEAAFKATLVDITGAVAEAFFGIPDAIRETAPTFLDDELREVTLRFTEKYCR